MQEPFAPRSLPASPLLRLPPTPAAAFASAGLPSSRAELSAPSDSCCRFRVGRSPKFPCRTFGTRHVPMPRPAGRGAKRIRRVRVGFGYHDPLDHGRPFGWEFRGVHTRLHFRLAHSFVGLGFCTSVALRADSLPIGMSFSLPYRFLCILLVLPSFAWRTVFAIALLLNERSVQFRSSARPSASCPSGTRSRRLPRR